MVLTGIINNDIKTKFGEFDNPGSKIFWSEKTGAEKELCVGRNVVDLFNRIICRIAKDKKYVVR